MQNIFKIFIRDIGGISRHFFAIIVAVAILLLPSLYAWLNIYSNSDPYGNTGNISIALCSLDTGYTNKRGTFINKGETVLDVLSESDSIDWVIVDDDIKATEGVDSGEYYAAVIIGEDFTYNMYHILSDVSDKPEITYYENSKKNAVAAKITETAMEKLKTSINENYLEVVIDSVMQQSNKLTDNVKLRSPKKAIYDVLLSAKTALQSAISLNEDYEKTMKNSDSSINTSEIESIISQINSISEKSEDYQSSIAEIDLQVYQAINEAQSALDLAEQSIDDKDNQTTATKRLETSSQHLREVSESLQEWSNRFSDSKIEKELKKVIGGLADDFKELSSEMHLISASNPIDKTISSARESVKSILNTISKTLVPSATDLQETINKTLQDGAGSLKDISLVSNDANKLTDSVSNAKTALSDTEGQVTAEIENICVHLDSMLNLLDNIDADGNIDKLINFLGGNPKYYGTYFSQMVQTQEDSVYPVGSYGAAMAPFYTVLAIWVGLVMLTAIIKSHPSSKGLVNPHPNQLFFGRYLIFFVLSQIQAAIIVTGDLFLLNLKCELPGMLYLSAAITSFVLSLFIYSLVVSFGDVGKGLVVIIMVLQIAGSSGTFPIELLPELYQKIYKLFPFPYAINAMRECFCGMYDNIFIVEISYLMIFAMIGLVIGLFVRKPFIGMNKYVEEQLEEAELF